MQTELTWKNQCYHFSRSYFFLGFREKQGHADTEPSTPKCCSSIHFSWQNIWTEGGFPSQQDFQEVGGVGKQKCPFHALLPSVQKAFTSPGARSPLLSSPSSSRARQELGQTGKHGITLIPAFNISRPYVTLGL